MVSVRRIAIAAATVVPAIAAGAGALDRAGTAIADKFADSLPAASAQLLSRQPPLPGGARLIYPVYHPKRQGTQVYNI